MYEFIKGKVAELNPTYVIVENNGIGYFINISLNTFSKLAKNKDCNLFVHLAVREDALTFFGFFESSEREIFRQLISVSGIGTNTARMMLSSLSPDEIRVAILHSDVMLLKSIKGIGAKTAQRIILDLKDKLGKLEGNQEVFASESNRIKEEALSALEILGFSKNSIEKVLNKTFIEDNNMTVEELIKKVLKQL